jgi:hypothetical protein
MKLGHSQLPALLDDFDASVAEMKAALSGDPAAWARAPAGRWSAGQHADHVAMSIDSMIDRFEANVDPLRSGSLGRPPRRGLLQAIAVRLLMREPFPKGAKAQEFVAPGPTPARETAFRHLDEGTRRYRALAERLTPKERERIWIINPFQESRRWHYRLFESVRVQTTHTRHHMRLALQAAKG